MLSLASPGWKKQTLLSTGKNRQSISQTTQTEPLTTTERMKLYKELQPLLQPTPIFSLESILEKTPPTQMKLHQLSPRGKHNPDCQQVNGRFTAAKVCKTTITTEAGTSEVKVPGWYQEFTSVFAEEEAHHFPPSWPCNHAINLDDSFVPKVGKVYPLTLKEQKATEEFLKENLQLGRIHPSNSHQAASFFFVDKKDASNTLQPCQDYQYVNSHTIKDTQIFTKFDIQWGYNNIHIQDSDQWKAAFITHKGLFKPTVMFFGLCNSPPTFQWFMNDSFRDMIAEGWLIVYMDDLLISSPDTDLNTVHQTSPSKVEGTWLTSENHEM